MDFALWAGLTPESVHRVDDLLAAGAVGLKAFGCESGWEDFRPVDSRTLRGGLRAADRVGAVVALHAELPHAQRAGTTDLRSADRAEDAETPAVAWAARRVAESARLHLVHVSAAGAVAEASRWPGVTVETCPHYLTLDSADAAGIGAAAVCNPPIRDAGNQARLWGGLRDGQIHSVASDHSPCPPELRSGPRPWAGIAGVQTMLPVLLSTWLDPVRLAELGAAAAGILRLPGKGALAVGYDADLVLVDRDVEWTLTAADLLDRHPVSPWLGARFRGRVEATNLRGRVVYRRGDGVADAGGQFITRAALPPEPEAP